MRKGVRILAQILGFVPGSTGLLGKCYRFIFVACAFARLLGDALRNFCGDSDDPGCLF